MVQAGLVTKVTSIGKRCVWMWGCVWSQLHPVGFRVLKIHLTLISNGYSRHMISAGILNDKNEKKTGLYNSMS